MSINSVLFVIQVSRLSSMPLECRCCPLPISSVKVVLFVNQLSNLSSLLIKYWGCSWDFHRGQYQDSYQMQPPSSQNYSTDLNESWYLEYNSTSSTSSSSQQHDLLTSSVSCSRGEHIQYKNKWLCSQHISVTTCLFSSQLCQFGWWSLLV